MGARAARTKPASSKAAAHQDTGFIKTFPVTGEFSLALRMHLALGCAEAVQSLHAQSPPVVHGDIKSQNFLLHDDFLVKVADLELASRCLQGGRDVFSNNPYSGGIGGGDLELVQTGPRERVAAGSASGGASSTSSGGGGSSSGGGGGGSGGGGAAGVRHVAVDCVICMSSITLDPERRRSAGGLEVPGAPARRSASVAAARARALGK